MTKKEFSIIIDEKNIKLNKINFTQPAYFTTIIKHTDSNIFIPFRDIFNKGLTEYFKEYEFIKFDINGIKFEFKYNRIKKVISIKAFKKITFRMFERYSNSILASYGFLTGYIPRNNAFYFAYHHIDDEEFYTFKYADNLANTYKSHYKIFAFSKDKNRNCLGIESFKCFCYLLSNDDKFSNAIHLMMESNMTNSILLQPIGYSAVLEKMVRVIYSINDNKQSKSSQLFEQFKKQNIPINNNDEKIIKSRHDIFHGKLIVYGNQIKDFNIDSINKICRLNFLINSLIMKFIGHSGYIIEIKYYNDDNTPAEISYYHYEDIGNLPNY